MAYSLPSVLTTSEFFSSKSGTAPDDYPFLNWQFPVLSVLVYVAGKLILGFLCKKFHTTGESLPFRIAVIMHNMMLCIYSCWTAYSAWSFVFHSYQKRGFLATYCDYDYQMWSNGLGYVNWLFYLSKVWEFVDTLILIVKQKPVSLLQFYHHCGALLSMWGLVVSRSPQTVIFACLNSVIHTIMYAYFTSAALKRPFPINRSTITQLQLAQFFVGWAAGTPTLFAMVGINSFGRSDWIGKCTTEAAAFASFFTSLYLFPLVILFIQFYVKNYINPPRKGVKKSE